MAALVAAALSFAACGSNGGEPAPSPSVGGAATPAPPETSTPGAEPPPLPDGRSFGYIKAVDASQRTLTFDLAQLLVGQKAIDAAVMDGAIQAGESLDNDYYIRNESPKLRTLRYVEDVEIRLVNWPDCCDKPIDGDLGAFVAAFSPAGKNDLYRGPDSQYALVVEGGGVVRIKEQYLP